MVRARRRPQERRTIINSPITLYFCIAYLILALVMTMAGKFPDFGALFPHWLYSTFNPNDKTNLAPYRFLHFVVIVILVIRFVPKDWPGLEWKIFDPLVVCGQQSLAVFCVGVFLSFVGHFELSMSSGSLFAQIFVSVTGIAIMTIVAYYISWSKRQDKPLPAEPPSFRRAIQAGPRRPAATGLHALRGRVDVADIEVIKPEWDRSIGRLVNMPPTVCPRRRTVDTCPP
jgi:hypothetical protein